jgi:hypothetical protein
MYATPGVYINSSQTRPIYCSVYISWNAIDFNRGAYIFPTCVDLVYFFRYLNIVNSKQTNCVGEQKFRLYLIRNNFDTENVHGN